MLDTSELPGYNKWQDYCAIKSTVPVTWTAQDLDFTWQRIELVNEIDPNKDFWNTFASSWMLKLQDLFRSWNCSVEGTVHYMSYLPKLGPNLLPILDHFKYQHQSYNLLKITTGCSIAWHFDTFSSLVKRENLSREQWDNLYRSIILLEDWRPGQVIEIGNEVVSHWHAGDVLTYSSQVWHGAANFGKDDLVVMQLSYLNDH